MGWLFAQLWFWLLVAFLIGSLAAILVVRSVLPSVEELERSNRLNGGAA